MRVAIIDGLGFFVIFRSGSDLISLFNLVLVLLVVAVGAISVATQDHHPFLL